MLRMKTISETQVLLYYRRPYEYERELICACESEEVANEETLRLREEWPHLYYEPARFEKDLITYVRRDY